MGGDSRFLGKLELELELAGWRNGLLKSTDQPNQPQLSTIFVMFQVSGTVQCFVRSDLWRLEKLPLFENFIESIMAHPTTLFNVIKFKPQ